MDQWSGVEEPLNYVAFRIVAVCAGTRAVASYWLTRARHPPRGRQPAFVDITIIFAHHQYLDC